MTDPDGSARGSSAAEALIAAIEREGYAVEFVDEWLTEGSLRPSEGKVVVRRADPADELFALAHEYAHILLATERNDQPGHESAANYSAGKMLARIIVGADVRGVTVSRAL